MAIFNSYVKLPEGNMFILVFTMFILSENMGTYGTMMRIPWNIAGFPGFPLNFPNMSLEIILGFSSLIFVFFLILRYLQKSLTKFGDEKDIDILLNVNLFHKCHSKFPNFPIFSKKFAKFINVINNFPIFSKKFVEKPSLHRCPRQDLLVRRGPESLGAGSSALPGCRGADGTGRDRGMNRW